MAGQRDLRGLSERIEVLVENLHAVADPKLRQDLEELIQSLTALYGAGLGRIWQILDEQKDSKRVIDSLCKDDLVASLFTLHGLHSQDGSAVARGTQSGARCELCGNALTDRHGHIAEILTRKLLCACRACSFLFDGAGAVRSKYKTVPRRYRYLGESVLTAAQWSELEIPVGIAFFFFNSSLNRTVACYPGPAGATESLLPLESWNNIVRAHPLLEGLSADVEALLVDNLKERRTPGCFVVPIDACYELVARLRRHWTGFDGGDEARREIAAFFDELRSRSEAATLAR